MDVDLPDNLVPFLLLASFRGLIDELHDQLAQRGFDGVRAMHGMAMQAVGGGCTATELARRLGVSKQSASKTVQLLGSMGLLHSATNPADRREKLVVPSERGREMLAESGLILTQLIARWRQIVGDLDVNRTIRTLATVDHGRRSMTDVSDWL